MNSRFRLLLRLAEAMRNDGYIVTNRLDGSLEVIGPNSRVWVLTIDGPVPQQRSFWQIICSWFS